ncbi:MAG: dihydroxyacetone kinase subunit L [Alphaproteobacteria bacterium]|nr:dihydroxyacetone kinase subunit L [Alphaproteobacteria bacterium]
MNLEASTLRSLIAAAAEQVIASAPELTTLDQAIGDGDHGINMKRGFEAVLGKIDAITAQPLGEAVKTVGKTLVMTVGGASGPLYGSFFIALGDAIRAGRRVPEDLAEIFACGVDAVSARGRSKAGEKTMLDVLVPVLETLRSDAGRPDLMRRVHTTASEAVERTAPMLATKGRASFLGSRSIGHIDPGARSSCVLVHAICTTLETHL